MKRAVARAAAFFVVAAAAATATAAHADEVKVLTLPKGRGGHFFARVVINGVDAGEFLVDTGATTIAIPPALARECHVDGPYRRMVGKTANGVTTGLVGKAVVAVGPFSIPDVEVAVLENAGTPLLGMSFLSQLDVHLGAESIELRSDRDMPSIEVAEIEPSAVKMSPIGLPPQIGDAKCSYDDAGDRWKCDTHVYKEKDGAVAVGAGVKVAIELNRSSTCLASVRMKVTSSKGALVVPWYQSRITANGVVQPVPSASIGRADKAGTEVSYVLSLADRCFDDAKPHDMTWSVPLLVDGKPARVRWMHRWTPATETEDALFATMTPLDPPPKNAAADTVVARRYAAWQRQTKR